MVVAILIIVAGGILQYNKQTPEGTFDKATTICIAEGATLYATEWCGYCKMQKEMFGDNLELLNIIDCDKDRDLCVEAEIRVFPTWIIDGEQYTGVKTEEQLKELTGC